ncbi:MAG: heterodisulfide reductase-related iron-sulfur binding cluster [bacterium JZ-2024 1]
MRVSYFPGCYQKNIDPSYAKSLDILVKQLGIETEEILNWSCCGTEAIERSEALFRVALPIRNVAISEKLTRNPVLFAPCPHCFRNFSYAVNYMANGDSETKKKVLEALEIPYQGKTQIRGLFQVLEDHQASQKMKKLILRELKGIKVACYYGCKTLSPAEYVKDLGDPNTIDLMERYLKAAGAEPVPWQDSRTCNGGLLSVADREQGLKMIARVLLSAIEAGADCIAVACPVCFHNLDSEQEDALRTAGQRGKSIPIFYFMELLALAMGQSVAKLDLAHTVRTDGILKKIGISLERR